MDDSTLRQLIRDKLRDGRLPVDSIPRIWGGAGAGEACDACGDLVTKDVLIMEGVSASRTGQSVQFHVRCFYMWDQERREKDLVQ